jgi:cytosine/adenosine deaminase-related metal-dependent hydrolase
MQPRILFLLLALAACSSKTDSDIATDTGNGSDTGIGTDTGEETDTDTGTDTNSYTECGNDLGTTAGVCDVTEGTGDALLLRGNLLTPSEILRTGELLIDASGEIICAACDCSDIEGYAAATTVTCPEGVVSPGLINPHDHIGYTEGAPIDHGATRYDHRHDWRGSLSTPSNNSDLGRELGEVRMIMGGTTSMVGSGYANGMVRNLDESANEGLSISNVNNQTFPLGDSNESFKSNCDWNYRDTEREVAQDEAYLPHIAEGIDSYAAEEFRCSSTSFDGAQDYTEPNAAHVHSIGLSTKDYYRMALDGTQIVWSPRSNISLYGHTAQVTTFNALGGKIALGTDWTYSGSIHSVRELACADELNRTYYDNAFTDRDLWEMATVNGAVSTGTEQLLGTLEVGRVADVAVFDGSSSKAFRAIIDAPAEGVALVLRAGEPLYGEQDTLTELGKSCEMVGVCGATMAICAEQEFGATYDAIIQEAAGDYAAFFCGDTPDNEPSCIPARTGEFSGQITADDSDGDGIDNASDNCPTVFNPIRPIDANQQPDLDGDGDGDACDDNPLLDDLDNDGVANEDDNCPFDDNETQTDGDEDAKGDECDACPAQANPDSICLLEADTATIYDIQSGAVAEGNYVQITNVVVTSITGSGFSVQDPALVSNPAYSGIYIYTSSTPTVTRGDVVEIEGEVGEYYDWTQLQAGLVTVLTSAGTGTCTDENVEPVITPALLTAEDAADEAYEGVLVTLIDTAVTDFDYDCSVDGSACNDEFLWEVGGSEGVLIYDNAYECADWADRIGNVPVTGVMMFRWERRRLVPRLGSDFSL